MSRRRNSTRAGGAARKAYRMPRREVEPDATGRVDIALTRLLEMAVGQYADVPVRAVYNAMKTQIDMGIRAVVGPRTQVGINARGAVAAIRAVAGSIAPPRGNGGNAA